MTADLVWAIPSRGRADAVTGQTLTALADAGVSASAIDLWVDSDQADAYRDLADPSRYGRIRVAPREQVTGQRAKRNHVVRQYPPGTRLIQTDDDITAYQQARTRVRPLLPVRDLPAAAAWAFDTCDRVGLGLWGPYPISNPFFMRPVATTDLRVITGGLFGLTVTGDDTELVAVNEKEDFERSVRFAVRDGGVLRCNWLCFDTAYYSGQPGGFSDYRTEDTITADAMALAAAWPDHVRYLGPHGSRGHAEVRLRRGTPRCPPILAPQHD